ncbi:MAG TPA: hypothetical protein VN026_16450 [Bacteroidia bacterium]|jgi:hypothetical protein|nr:hypothetical protein [Bacteroidia bacterium]
MKESLKHSAVIIFLLPLLFFNIKNTHDWGDDFAQYLLEAKNIKEGKPIAQTGFVENPNYVLGPNCYPPGFPIIIALTSFEVSKLNVLMSFFLLCIGYFSFLLFNKRFHFPAALAMSLVIAYNPLCLGFKNDIVSDLPFAAFVLLFFILYLSDNKKIWMLILCGFVLAFAIEIRYVGWVLFIALILETIYKICVKYFRHKQHKVDWNFIKHEIWIVGSVLVFYGIFYMLFPQKIIYYPNPKAHTLFETISLNANYNYATLKYFFSCFDEGFLNYLVSYGIIFTALIGMLIFIFKPDQLKPTILLFFFSGIIVSVLIHPYTDTGFRLLLPIIPLVLFFAAYALFIILAIVPYKQYVVFCLGLLVLFCYKQHSLYVFKTGKNIIPGPYTFESAAAFLFIKNNVPKDASIMFSKPRALTYFTGYKTFVNTELAPRKVLISEIEKFKPDYFLINLEATDDSTKAYFMQHPPSWKIIYNNKKFGLYKHGNVQ